MSGEPDVNGSYHDDRGRFVAGGVSLKDYFESLNAEHDRSHIQLDKAIDVALASMDKRLDGMNEFRGSLEDFQARAITREVFEQRSSQVDRRLNDLERIIVGRDIFESALKSRDDQIDMLASFKNKATGIGVVVVLFAGLVGAAIVKAFG
jgi:hypothetical protein